MTPRVLTSRALALFAVALDVPQSARTRFATSQCGSDSALLDEVLELLKIDGADDLLLDHPLDPAHVMDVPLDELVGAVVGGYRLLARLGSGGMGTVFRAERIDGVAGHTIALKLVKQGMDSQQIVRRFLRERQILAQLKHPNIAHLIDGGSTELDRVWFAMELVDGKPITDWCDERRSTVKQRIEQFFAVCSAVQYAHGNLVVHCDLKPSNILVSDTGQVKLLDFGIAKLLAENGGDEEITGQVSFLTPDFSAPEQLRREMITTATDVYQLGLVLFELITGQRFAKQENLIPSTRIGSRATRMPELNFDAEVERASARQLTTAALRKILRGDLDTIIRKALQDEPSRRYQSVGDLDTDLRCYLHGRPVRARPDGTLYRARRFVQRNKLASMTTVAAVLALTGTTLYSVHFANAAREQLGRADAAKAFLAGVFSNADPDENNGLPITAHQLLEKGEGQLANESSQSPIMRNELLALIGGLYLDLGDYAKAESLLKQALKNASDSRTPPEIKADIFRKLASMEIEQHELRDAVIHARAAVTMEQEADQFDDEEGVDARRVLAAALNNSGYSTEGLGVLKAVMARDLALHGPQSEQLGFDWMQLAGALDETIQASGKVDAYKHAISIFQALHGRENGSLAQCFNALGILLAHEGDRAGAENALRGALQIAEKLYGPDHRLIFAIRSNLLFQVEEQGRISEALPGRIALLERATQHAKERPSELAYANYFLAIDEDALGRMKEAEGRFKESLRSWKQIQGSNDELESGYPTLRLADTLTLEGRFDEAEALYHQALSIASRRSGASSTALASDAHGHLGTLLRLRHRTEDAIRELEQSIPGKTGPERETQPQAFTLRAALAEAQLDAGQVEAARISAEQALSMARQAAPAGSLRLGSPLLALGRIKMAIGRPGEAEPLLREARAVRSPPYPPTDLRVLEVDVELVRALVALKKLDDASDIKKKAQSALLNSRSPISIDLLTRLSNP